MDNQEFDLLKDWQKLTSEKFTHNIKTQDIMDAINKESNSAISKLKKNLKAKITWILFFILSFSVWMLFSLEKPELLMIVGGINFIYIIALIGMYYHYKKMDNGLDYSGNTLKLMKKNYTLINNALNFEKMWGLFVFPIAVFVGSLISKQYNGFTIAETIGDSTFMFRIIILTMIIVPLGYYFSRKMNHAAFGNIIEKLKDNITRLEMIS